MIDFRLSVVVVTDIMTDFCLGVVVVADDLFLS